MEAIFSSIFILDMEIQELAGSLGFWDMANMEDAGIGAVLDEDTN